MRISDWSSDVCSSDLPPAQNWHADGTYLDRPHSVTMLYGREAPEEGGETWFAGTAQAYDDLDGEARAALDGLMVKHVKNGGGDKLALTEEHESAIKLESQRTEEERKGMCHVHHTMVLRHAGTGRPGPYSSTTRLTGPKAREK